MKKGIQYFSEEYLKRCKGATPEQILEFLENFRLLISSTQDKSKWIRPSPFEDKTEDR
jgi:hypothetical protein